MKDFGAWFNDQALAPIQTAAQAHIDGLEDAGVIWAMSDGTFKATCCRCGNRTEPPVGPEEIDLDYEHYCGGSPRCCP